MDAITRLGCIVCFLAGFPETPCIRHHLLTDGGRRIGHLFSIGLCEPGHHQYPPKESGKIARHPTKARFEAAYGSEEFLLEKSRELVAESRRIAA